MNILSKIQLYMYTHNMHVYTYIHVQFGIVTTTEWRNLTILVQ